MEERNQRYGMDTITISRKRKAERYFAERYGHAPARWFSSPGRAEIIGNHTDHNGGKVIVSAISRDILCAAEKRDDGIIEICAEEFYPVRVNVRYLQRKERERGKSAALVRGVARALSDMGYSFGGFSAYTSSNLFRGAGISSSAAFELLIAEILNCLYLDGRLTVSEKIHAGKFAENEYFGKPCGLLDQSGVALGGLNQIDFSDTENPFTERLPQLKGYSLVITNTGGSHSRLTGHYKEIGDDMRAVAGYFGKSVLREVPFGEFSISLPQVRKRAGDRAVLRALHFYEENERVEKAAHALRRGDTLSFLEQIRESGKSSLAYLQNCYIPGAKEQPITLALKISERLLKDKGACRIQGGGFAGTILAFVKKGEEAEYEREISRVFGEENIFRAEIREQGACEWNFSRLETVK